MNVFLNDGTPIKLSTHKLGDGGEGAVYSIDSTSPFREKCVKIYTQATPEKYEKIKFMVENMPKDFSGKNNGYKVCWPEKIIYDKNKKFIGFIMPCAYTNSATLNRFLSLPHKVSWINKYDRNSDSGLRNRIGMCMNIAQVFYFIHRESFYVIGDVKPHNILVDENCNISLVDLDSIQIIDKNKTFFSPVASPEYAAPEIMANTGTAKIYMSSDKFSLAILFYFILVGVHPYSVSPKAASADGQNSLQDLIKNGYYAHGKRKTDIHAMNRLHDNIQQLPVEIQILLQKALCDGVNNASHRAPASIWGELFSKVLNDQSSHTLVTRHKTKVSNRVTIPKKKVENPFHNSTLFHGWIANLFIK